MRLAMTRVLPEPAPARISSGPVGVQDGLALFGIQRFEELHRTDQELEDGSATMRSDEPSQLSIVARRPPTPDRCPAARYSTVTLLARLRGWSTSQPRRTAMWYASSCSGTTITIGVSSSGVARHLEDEVVRAGRGWRRACRRRAW